MLPHDCYRLVAGMLIMDQSLPKDGGVILLRDGFAVWNFSWLKWVPDWMSSCPTEVGSRSGIDFLIESKSWILLKWLARWSELPEEGEMTTEASLTISHIYPRSKDESSAFLEDECRVGECHRFHHRIIGDQPHGGCQLSVFYRQAYLGIPLGCTLFCRGSPRSRTWWCKLHEGLDRFGHENCVIPYILCGLYCRRCWSLFEGGPCPPLYIQGDRVTWKVLTEYSWNPTTT